jgi:hypothetical protein
VDLTLKNYMIESSTTKIKEGEKKMRILAATVMILTAMTVNAKEYKISLDFLTKKYCSNHALHITQESCINQVESCVLHRISTRHPIQYTTDERAAIAYLACSHELSADAISSNNQMIHLKFKDFASKQKWLIWYLDEGGEEQSEFLVENWEWNTLFLNRDVQ